MASTDSSRAEATHRLNLALKQLRANEDDDTDNAFSIDENKYRNIIADDDDDDTDVNASSLATSRSVTPTLQNSTILEPTRISVIIQIS